MFYTPHTQQPSYHTMRLVVRADAEPAALTAQVREELNQIDREVPLSQVATLSRALDATVAEPRMRAQPARIVCGPGDGAGRDRRLRRGRVHGRPAHAGDRRPPRARREGRRCAGDAVARSDAPGRDRHRDRHRRRVCDDAAAGGDAVRDLGHRRHHLRGRLRRARGCGAAGVDRSRPPRASASIRSPRFAASKTHPRISPISRMRANPRRRASPGVSCAIERRDQESTIIGSSRDPSLVRAAARRADAGSL